MKYIVLVMGAILFGGCATTQVARYQHAPEVVKSIDEVVQSLPDEFILPVEFALYRAQDNAVELVQALNSVENERRLGMAFLIQHMPIRDLTSLDSDFMVENVMLAYQAWEEMPWKESISQELFLNYVLPYINLTETRENWRRIFYEKFAELAREKGTINAVVQYLNNQVYADYGISYNIKKRARPDQSPSETIASQVASCTGLSIMTVNMLRSVGIPARVVGTPLWQDKSGNHTWFEVWDAGQWHYIGAGEKGGYNEAWFTKAASHPNMLNPQFRIYAVSYQRTDTVFPTIWNPYAEYIFAVDVTESYQK